MAQRVKQQAAPKAEDVKIFNPETSEWGKPTANQAELVKEHEAQVAGMPAPGDRSEDELRSLEAEQGVVAASGPVVTAAAPNETPAAGATGAGDGGTAAGTRANTGGARTS